MFATIGSLGDLHPCLGMALELQRRGHRVSIASTPFYRTKVEGLGLAFHPMRPDWNPTDAAMIAQCEEMRSGPEVLIRKLVLPHVRDSYRDLLGAAAGADIIVAGELVYSAPLVAEKLGVRWATAILSPCSFFSAHDPSLLVAAPEVYRLRNAGVWTNRAILGLSRWITNGWWTEIRRLREAEYLGKGRNPLLDDKFSPHLVLALFSTALADAQPDWPPQTRQPGFVWFDKAGSENAEPLSRDLQTWLAAGTPPIIFTQGSTAAHNPGEFFRVSAEAARRLGQRALLIGVEGPRPGAVTGREDCMAVRYAPYSQVFRSASVVVHQGGSGTTGLAIAAGRPMLIVPYGWDQPDNAARMVRRGAALTLSREDYTVERATLQLQRLMHAPSFSQAAARLQQRIQGENGTISACDEIERVLQ